MKTGIPTNYQSRTFRSRLEARWASFFDILEWQYEYEPYDLNGWIPDFSIIGDDEIIVEVKPFFKFKEFDIGKIQKALSGTNKNSKEVLCLGATILRSEHWNDGATLGWLWQSIDDEGNGYLDDEGNGYFDEAIFNNWKGRYGFFHSSGSWKDRITGIYDGALDVPTYYEIRKLWNEAGDNVQWMKP